MTKIPVVGFDPAFANFGIAKVLLDTTTLELEVVNLNLIQTEKDKSGAKVVRKNSDDLRRAQEIYAGMVLGCTGQRLAFAEIPSGAQDANASRAFGIAVGIMAAVPIPLIQVQNFEAKLAAVGTRTASKQEMIEWATEKYPNANWIRAERGGKSWKKGDITAANEHLADALAIIEAGVRTQEFKRTLAFMGQLLAAA